jgi:HAD superfamily 5'-nucleotidase-like hydrolase
MLPMPELLLSAEAGASPSRVQRVYVNRNLRLDHVEAIGFDMDYTLAIYNQPEMDRLSIEATVHKLIERGYPERLRTMPYRTDFAMRGLLIDKKLGNVLKMDRYRYVKKAYHGMRELTREERRTLYHTQRIRVGTPRYHWVDTLYALSEVCVFVAVIDALEKDGLEVDYATLFTDVRSSIDLAHQDGSILNTVMSDLPRFVRRDPALGATLHKLRSAGKKLFVLTNSRAAYTDVMMNYLVGDALPEYPSWRNYFDVIITAAGKPRFFTEEAALLEVDDHGATTTRVATALERGRVYSGGNIAEFERLMDTGGDRILYVGDHIYGDVLRAKKDSAWRTAMIVQEMAEELAAHQLCSDDLDRLSTLEHLRDTMYDALRARQRRWKELSKQLEDLEALQTSTTTVGEDAVGPGLESPTRGEVEVARLREKRAIDRVRTRLRSVDGEVEDIEDRVDRAFHPFWGSLFKSGPEVSIFGDQVEQYACLYTERVSNLGVYSPMYYFRSPRDRMPHEL